MLHFGLDKAELEEELVPEAICPSCGTKGSTMFTVYGKYFYALIFPVFPYSKVVESECEHCEHFEEEKAFNSTFQIIAEDLKSTSKYGFGLYFFWILATVILCYNVFWKKGWPL